MMAISGSIMAIKWYKPAKIDINGSESYTIHMT